MRIEKLETAQILPPVETKKRPVEVLDKEPSPMVAPAAPALVPEDDLPQMPETD